jgi:nucleolar protein 15
MSTAKRAKTGSTVKVNPKDVKPASNAVTNRKKAPKQAKPQRQAASPSSASNKAVAGDDVELGSSDSDEGSDGGALVEALDLSSEDEEDTRPTALKRSNDIESIAQAVRARKSSKISAGNGDSAEEGRGVMYVGRLPNGFFEHELRAYFSQFGEVTRLRVSRNRRTGASKGYAFIEFAEAEVCEIAAKTMDHYLLFGHILKCKVIPTESVPDGLWKGANRRFK